jgi:hypothetical protein
MPEAYRNGCINQVKTSANVVRFFLELESDSHKFVGSPTRVIKRDSLVEQRGSSEVVAEHSSSRFPLGAAASELFSRYPEEIQFSKSTSEGFALQM